MTDARTGAARADYLDLFKTMLIYGMVTTHVVQLVTADPGPELLWFADFINLITFSGFLLAFGLGVGMSGDRVRPWPARLKPVLLLLLAAWISAFAFVVLVEREYVSGSLVFDLLTFRRLFGWSEFLASFCVLYLVIAIARPSLVRVADNPLWLALVIAASLASTLLVIRFYAPVLATLVGTRNFASFPILPYLPWFFAGIWLGRRRRGPNLLEWGIAAVATAAFIWALASSGDLPGRFPPTVLWIVGAALPLAVYLLVARTFAASDRVPDLLRLPGRHVLGCLLVSNLAIFGLRHIADRPLSGTAAVLGAAALLLALVTLWSWILERRRSVRRNPVAT